MKRIIHTEPGPTKFLREPEISIDGFTISQGDLFKVKGEYGNKFRFVNFITNSKSFCTVNNPNSVVKRPEYPVLPSLLKESWSDILYILIHDMLR
jgi:hypothetical protein